MALISKGKKPSGGVVGVIVFLVFFFAYIVMGGQFSVNVVENDHRLNFFGISLPWLPVVLLYQLPIAVLPPPGRHAQDGVAAAASALQAAGHRGHADLRDPGARRDLAAGRVTRSIRWRRCICWRCRRSCSR